MNKVNGMEFAKYYNGIKVLGKLIKESKVFSYQEDYCKGIYVCLDIHDVWVCRILDNINKDYDTEEGKWLVERNKIDKYELIDFINEQELTEEKWEVNNRNDLHYVLNNIPAENLIRYTILFDDNQGLENWDNYEYNNLKECVEAIDGGFGIIEL